MKKYFKYNEEVLNFEPISRYEMFMNNIRWVFTMAFTLIVILSFVIPKERIIEYIKPEGEMVVVNKNENEFSEKKLVEFIGTYNFKFPHIVMAQSMLETGHFTSVIFKENNNLFGMKQARVRLNVAKGTNRGHAYYSGWTESVTDYALYYASYLRKLNTEKEYYEYLSKHYAEDKTYVSKLKAMVKKEKLKEKFD